MHRRQTCALLTAAAAIVASVPLLAQQTFTEPPPGPGLDLIQRACINCHDVYMITSKRKTPAEWAAVVGLMADRGAEVTPEELQVIEDYLAQNFSTAVPEAAVAH